MCFIKSYLFQQKMVFLVETIPFSGSQFFFLETIGLQQKSFYSVETVPFNGRDFLYWKLFTLVEILSFSASHFRQWKPFFLGKAFVFLGNHCPQLKRFCIVEAISFQRKLFLFIETFPFCGSHSCQCFDILASRSYDLLRELLNIQCQILIVLDY